MHGHKIVNQNAVHFLTFTVVGWLDVFTRQKYKEMIIDSLKYCQREKGLIIYAYVIMSNHIHIIAEADESNALSNVVRDFKRHTSKEILKEVIESSTESRQEWMTRLFKYYAKYNKNNKTYQFWQRDNRPIELSTPKWFLQKLNYIHMNPVKAGVVIKAEDYIYSSASNYSIGKGVIDVKVIDLGSGIGYVAGL